MKMLSIEEKKLLAEAVLFNQSQRDISKRASQTKDAKDTWKAFYNNEIEGRKILTPISLSDEWFNIYTKASNTVKEDINIVGHRVKTLENVINRINANLVTISNEVNKKEEISFKLTKQINLKNKELFFNYFKFLSLYETKAIDIIVNLYEGEKTGEKIQEKRVCITFATRNTFLWKVEFPFVDKNGFFTLNGSEFIFMYTPKNLEEYLTGEAEELILVHPFEKLCREMCIAYRDKNGMEVLLDKKFFFQRVEKCGGKISQGFQKAVNKFVTNAKDFYWEKNSTSPIVWFDRFNGEMSRHCFTNNILLDMGYEDVIKYGKVKGLDLLTGSTSTPAKRVQLASNYAIAKNDQGECVVKKVRDLGDLADYLSADKTAYVFYNRTSGKRQNSATIKDSCNLVNPANMIKRAYIK